MFRTYLPKYKTKKNLDSLASPQAGHAAALRRKHKQTTKKTPLTANENKSTNQPIYKLDGK